MALVTALFVAVLGLFAGRLVGMAAGQRVAVTWSAAERHLSATHPDALVRLRPWIETYFGLKQQRLPALDRAVPLPQSWRGQGADPDYVPVRPTYAVSGRPLPLAEGATGTTANPPRRTVSVFTSDQLVAALGTAKPGDEIVVEPGLYEVRARRIRATAEGTSTDPIRVRARRLGDALIRLDSLEGFYVAGPYWIFENLEVEGACGEHDACEHAFHIVGRGLATVLRNNRIHDFNSLIKVNGSDVRGEQHYPDGGLIERNSLYNSTIRRTRYPVTPVDIVAANHWRVTSNLIADFAKGSGDRTSYAGFIKGDAVGGIFENNLVICSMHLPLTDDIRVGLSLGGGGTAADACRGGRCEVESREAIIRNNIILHCSDVGVYLNRASNARVLNNTLFNTWGIDIRFEETDAAIINNLYTGRIADRDGGRSTRGSNLRIRRDSPFADPANGDFSLVGPSAVIDGGARLSEVGTDFCGRQRSDQRHDLGALEYEAQDLACEPFGPT